MFVGRTHTQCPPVLILVAAGTLMLSGCMRALGLSRSSLSPRTAAVDHVPQTLRSQDGPVASWDEDVSMASEPPQRARLLMPRFGHSGAPAPVARSVSAPEVAPPQGTGGFGHSLGLTASNFRNFLNGQSKNDMSEGRVLEDLPQRWPAHRQLPTMTVTSVTAASPLIGQPASVQSDAFPPVAARVAADDDRNRAIAEPLIEREAADSSVPGEQGVAPDAAESRPEPSVLDRLKDLYDPASESDPRNILKRQIRKLQSPWSVFRNQEQPASASISEEGGLGEVAVSPVDPTDGLEVSAASPSPASADLIQQLIAQRQRELEAWPRFPGGGLTQMDVYRTRQQELRLLYLIADEPGLAISSISELPGREQDFWQELMLALAQYRDNDETVPREDRLTGTVGQLRSAVRHLTPLTALSIRRLEMCSNIFSFGRVETFPSNDFEPGSPVLLYVEVDNFGSELTPVGAYHTSIDARIQFMAEGNPEPLETIEVGEIRDEATSERRDYFQSFKLNVPSYLAIGRYEIRLQLTDRITGKTAHDAIDFRVVAERAENR